MKTVKITEKRSLRDILPKGDEDVVLMRDGHAVALITPFDDDDLEWYARERDPAFIASIRRAREQVSRGKWVSHEDLMAELDGNAETSIRGDIGDVRSAVSVAEAVELVPHHPGLYAIYVDTAQSFPHPFASYLTAEHINLLYIGATTASLRQRLVEQDLRHKKPSTFFRSLGAVLGYTPETHSLNGKTNRQNYAFSAPNTRRLERWINEHLRLKWFTSDKSAEELTSLERRLIRHFCPILNLNNNPKKLAELELLREKCRRAARGP